MDSSNLFNWYSIFDSNLFLKDCICNGRRILHLHSPSESHKIHNFSIKISFIYSFPIVCQWLLHRHKILEFIPDAGEPSLLLLFYYLFFCLLDYKSSILQSVSLISFYLWEIGKLIHHFLFFSMLDKYLVFKLCKGMNER